MVAVRGSRSLLVGEEVGLGQQDQGWLGLQQGGDDAPWVAVEQTEEIHGQRVGPADLLHLLPQGLPGGQAHDGAGGHPEAREYRCGVENIGDCGPHGAMVYTVVH